MTVPKHFTRTLGLLLLCLMAAQALASGAIVCHAFKREEILDTENYWSMINRRSARPATMKEVTLDSFVPDSTAVLNGTLAGAAAAMVSTPAASTVTDPPFDAVGKLYYFDTGRKWCSATFTDVPNILLTSAHCVRSASGAYFNGIFFLRAATNDVGELFAIERVATLPEWITSATPDEYDYAFLRTTTSVNGVTPLTIETGSPAAWIGVGYPDEYFDGATLRVPDGMKMMHASGTGTTLMSPRMIRMDGIPLKHGMSGGPWVPPPTSPFGSTIVSVPSIHVSGENALLAPIFTERTLQLLETVKTCP